MNTPGKPNRITAVAACLAAGLLSGCGGGDPGPSVEPPAEKTPVPAPKNANLSKTDARNPAPGETNDGTSGRGGSTSSVIDDVLNGLDTKPSPKPDAASTPGKPAAPGAKHADRSVIDDVLDGLDARPSRKPNAAATKGEPAAPGAKHADRSVIDDVLDELEKAP